MTTICIIRHGETNWNNQWRFQGRENIELNETGRKQAFACVNYLKKEVWDIIISSPLIRAKETAKIIANKIGIKNVEIMNEFIEKDLGSATGLFPSERKKKFPDGIIPDAEPREYTRARAMEALKIIDNKYKDKNIIVVTHAGIINEIMSVLTDFKFDITKERIENGGITILKGNEGKWYIELFNSIEYKNL